MRLSDLLDPEVEWSEKDLPLGVQEPTHRLVPEAQGSHGHDAIEFAEYCGYELFEFQKQGLIDDLGFNMVELRDGSLVERWAAGETEEICSRRNGKSIRLEVIILFALFVLREDLIMYTAHRDDTSEKLFRNIVQVLKRTPKLWAEVIPSGPRYTNGQRSIELKTGQIVYFKTRTTDSARGQGYNRVILDEDQNLTDEQMAALMPLVSGAENAQLNYAGSAGGLGATVQASLWRDFEAKRRGLCYRGWHGEPDDDVDDLEYIARRNPRLGHGLSYEFIAKEFARMTAADFGRERCGTTTYPRKHGEAWVIPKAAWERALDEESRRAPDAKPVFVLESDPDLTWGTIGAAGMRADGAVHIEVAAHDPGVVWMVDLAKRIQDKTEGDVWIDPGGPVGFMLGDLRKAGVRVKELELKDLVSSSSWLYTAANPQPDPNDPEAGPPMPTVRHRGGRHLTLALASAETRKLLDRWTWRRRVATGVPQGPLMSCTIAGYIVAMKNAPSGGGAVPRKVSDREAPTRRRPSNRGASRRPPSGNLRTTGF